jgi:hypothetical protein
MSTSIEQSIVEEALALQKRYPMLTLGSAVDVMIARVQDDARNDFLHFGSHLGRIASTLESIAEGVAEMVIASRPKDDDNGGVQEVGLKITDLTPALNSIGAPQANTLKVKRK